MWDIARKGLCCFYGHTRPALPVLSSRQLLLLCPNRGAGRCQGPPLLTQAPSARGAGSRGRGEPGMRGRGGEGAQVSQRLEMPVAPVRAGLCKIV